MTPEQLAAAQRAIDDLRTELNTVYFRCELSDDDAAEFLRMLYRAALFLNLKFPGNEK